MMNLSGKLSSHNSSFLLDNFFINEIGEKRPQLASQK
jgi:hypothetical protein